MTEFETIMTVFCPDKVEGVCGVGALTVADAGTNVVCPSMTVGMRAMPGLGTFCPALAGGGLVSSMTPESPMMRDDLVF